VRSYPRHQPYRELDGEHHARLRHLHRSTVGSAGDIAPGLPLRAPEPPGQLAGRVRHRGAAGHQLSGSVDPRSVLITTSTTTINHDINILLDMSHPLSDMRRTLQPAITQRHLEAEVAHCVGGVVSPLLANVYLHRLDRAWNVREHEVLVRYADFGLSI